MATAAAAARKDREGKSFGEELERIGWKGEETVGARKMKAFFELHIEQGPILEDEGIDIGVVTHGQGLKWLQVTLTGKESHTGSTPMPKPEWGKVPKRRRSRYHWNDSSGRLCSRMRFSSTSRSARRSPPPTISP